MVSHRNSSQFPIFTALMICSWFILGRKNTKFSAVFKCKFDWLCLLSTVRVHSITTWTKFWPILTPCPPQVDNYEYFTWYLPSSHPLLVHVVIECPLIVELNNDPPKLRLACSGFSLNGSPWLSFILLVHHDLENNFAVHPLRNRLRSTTKNGVMIRRITPQTQIFSYDRRNFDYHIRPEQFRFNWFMPSLGVRSPCAAP